MQYIYYCLSKKFLSNLNKFCSNSKKKPELIYNFLLQYTALAYINLLLVIHTLLLNLLFLNHKHTLYNQYFLKVEQTWGHRSQLQCYFSMQQLHNVSNGLWNMQWGCYFYKIHGNQINGSDLYTTTRHSLISFRTFQYFSISNYRICFW